MEEFKKPAPPPVFMIKRNISVNTEVKPEEESAEVSPAASAKPEKDMAGGLPDWDLVPPITFVVRRKGR